MAVDPKILEELRARGFTNQEIAGSIQRTGAGKGVRQATLLESLAPVAGGLAGGALGALAGPAGIAAGGALGSSLGSAFKQKRQGRNQLDLGELFVEAGFGALGGLGKGAQAAKTVGKAGKSSRAAAATFAAGLPVGKPFTRTRGINPNKVAQEILDLGVNFGKGTTDDILRVTGRVTGSNGLVSNITRNSLRGARGKVNLSSIGNKFKSVLNKTPGLDDATVRRETSVFLRALNAKGKTQTLPDAFDTLRSLEKQLSVLRGQARGNSAKREVFQSLSKVYDDASKSILDMIEKAAQKGGVKPAISPEALAELSQISPKLADKVRGAKSISELRRIQSPFVKLSQIASESETAGGALTGVGRDLTGRVAGATVGGAAGGPVGAIGGALLGPTAEAALSGVRAPVFGKVAQGIQAVGKGAGAVKGAVTGPVAKQAGKQLLGRGVQATGQALEGKPIFGGVARGEAREILSADPETLSEEDAIIQSEALLAQTTGVGIPREAIVTAMIIDLQETGGKNISKIETIAEFANSGSETKKTKLSDTAISNVTDIQTAMSDLEGLRSVVGETTGIDIPGLGRRVTLPTQDTRIAQAEVDRVRQVVGKALEGGVLRKEDEEKYKRILPTVNDSAEVAQAKIDSIMNALNIKLDTFVELQNTRGRGEFQLDQTSPEEQLLSQFGGF